MEKRNFPNKTMFSVCRKDGSLTKDYREILLIQHDFFAELYQAEQKTDFTIVNTTNVRLDNIHKESLEAMISPREIFDAIMTLKTGKTPGCDGLSLAFYISSTMC